MSRIGKKAIQIPKDVSVTFKNKDIIVKGKNGTLELTIQENIKVVHEENTLVLTRENDTKRSRETHGLMRALIQNMITGVEQKFSKTLVAEGVGYKFALDKTKLILNMGYTHPVEFLIPADLSSLAPIDYLQKSFVGFMELNRQLINTLGLDQLKTFSNESLAENTRVIFGTQAGFMVMRFIAFAYTYHYLNWFSKTSLIQWHKVPRKTLSIVIAIWIISVAIYAYDFMLGLKWLFLLSFLHVLLEFPLNYRSVIGIGQEISGLFGKRETSKINSK
jgi:ribosomal protein L6P/L9E